MAARILVVDDELAMRMGLQQVLEKDGYAVETASDGEEAIGRLNQGGLDVVVSDLRMPNKDGFDVLRHIQTKGLDILVFMISAYGDIPTAVEAVKLGAQDFIEKPFNIQDVRARIRAGLDKRDLARYGKGDLVGGEIDEAIWGDFPEIIGKSARLARVLQTVKKVAHSPLPVLVLGETGTGKELIAKSLHRLSGRKGKCLATTGQLPDGLIESELFGHVKGSFTGATADKAGYFESADNGTLFLDEVGDLPMQVQVKLLRAIQEKEVVRVGEAHPRKITARLVAATNKDLNAAVEQKQFREDLLYRLNVITLVLPPLREREGAVRLLAEFFLKDAGKTLSDAAAERLEAHAWKGNVRELENTCRGIAVLAPGDVVEVDDVDMALD
ncbi:sigma-54 dependent transcriptional regulator [Planctomycetota bacterium]|nr:sigma-54 dependent transcriptional regulator [Planctomycetota bacterium]